MPEKKNTKKAPKNKEQDLTKNEIILTKELKKLSAEIRKLKKLEFVKVLNKPGRMIWLSFWKGMFVGFGTVIGASFLVGLFVFVLSKLSFVPFVGDFVRDVLQELDSNNVIHQQAEETAYLDRPSCEIPVDYLPEELLLQNG